jgi:ubiquinol-cytochrome c reductase iron-sulfur subunit
MSNTVDNDKRRFLTTAATVVVGGAGTVAAAVPFVSSMLPSAKAKAAGAPVEVDISKLEFGQQIIVEWRKKPVWILRRSEETLQELASVDDSLLDPNSDNTNQQPDYAKNPSRSIKDEFLVLIGVCTHLGCSPTYVPKVEAESRNLGDEWKGGFFCPCHGSKFDLAGRVYKGVPAPKNLAIPPYHFMGDNRIRIGDDSQGAA